MREETVPYRVNGTGEQQKLKFIDLFCGIIDAQSVVPRHRERIFLVGFKERRAFEFPPFPAQGPKLESIHETDVPDKYTLTNHLWN